MITTYICNLQLRAILCVPENVNTFPGGQVDIGSVTLMVKLGDITKENTEAVINSSTSNLAMSPGTFIHTGI